MDHTKPTQVVQIRRIVDQVVDDIATEVTKRTKKRDRRHIAVFGRLLVECHWMLNELRSLQSGPSWQPNVPEDLKQKILATESVFMSSRSKPYFLAIKELL